MSLRAELETWDGALKAYDAEDFEKALELFGRIADSSKILTNMGLIYATLGEHELAVEQFNAATGLDQYLAVASGDPAYCGTTATGSPVLASYSCRWVSGAGHGIRYFQCGVSNFLLGRYELAYKDFEEALLYLRGNQAINYEQLGLQFRLYSAEVLFNKGLCHIYLGNYEEGMQDMEEARKEKVTEEHKVIDEAIRDRGDGYTVFSIPVGILYRPPENKMRNAKPKDYLGKAKLVAAESATEAYTTFTGSTRMAQGYTPSGAPLETRPDQMLSVGGGLAPSPSFSRARNPETVKPVERAASATARLERQNTTLQVSKVREAANAQRANTVGSRDGVSSPLRERTTSPIRADTPPSSNTRADGLPMRGLSLRGRQDTLPLAAGNRKSPPRPGAAGRGAGPSAYNTSIYDGYLDGYNEEPPLPEDAKNVQAWTSRTQPGPPTGPSRPVTQRIGGSAYGARSQLGGSGAPRRRPTRQNTYGGRSRSSTRYEGEEEDDYGSGEYDEGFELIRIKVKIHYNGEVRGMALTPDTPYEEFLDRVHSKFNKSVGEMSMKFIDEDGMKVSLRDDSDYDLAIETARDSAKGKPDGKLVVWVD